MTRDTRTRTRDTYIAFGRLTHTFQIFIFQLVNTGLTPLLVALFSVRSQRNSQRERAASAAGEDSIVPDEYDYKLDMAWYELASSAVLLTMTALLLSLGSWPFVASLFDTMRLRRAQERRSVAPPCSPYSAGTACLHPWLGLGLALTLTLTLTLHPYVRSGSSHPRP